MLRVTARVTLRVTGRAALKADEQTGKPVRLANGGGLRLDAQPTGAGWWRLRYRFGGREGMLSLGTYPETGLQDARERRDETRRVIAARFDPSAHRRAGKAEQAKQAEAQALEEAGEPGPGTFEFVACEWLTTVHEANRYFMASSELNLLNALLLSDDETEREHVAGSGTEKSF